MRSLVHRSDLEGETSGFHVFRRYIFLHEAQNQAIQNPLHAYTGTYHNPGYGSFTICAPSSSSHYCVTVLEDFAVVDNVNRTRATPMKVGRWIAFLRPPKWPNLRRLLRFWAPPGAKLGACPALIAFLRLIRASIPGHFLTVAAAVTRVLARGDGNAD